MHKVYSSVIALGVHGIIGNNYLTSLTRFLIFVSSWTIGVIERTGSDGL